MSITKNLAFTKPQLTKFARLFRRARISAQMTQLQVAQRAFEYKVSHCKVSRVERAAMPQVDAHCLERMAQALGIAKRELTAIDPKFKSRAVVSRTATKQGFWDVTALRT